MSGRKKPPWIAEPSAPFYLGVTLERQLTWWERYRRRRALRKWQHERDQKRCAP